MTKLETLSAITGGQMPQSMEEWFLIAPLPRGRWRVTEYEFRGREWVAIATDERAVNAREAVGIAEMLGTWHLPRNRRTEPFDRWTLVHRPLSPRMSGRDMAYLVAMNN